MLLSPQKGRQAVTRTIRWGTWEQSGCSKGCGPAVGQWVQSALEGTSPHAEAAEARPEAVMGGAARRQTTTSHLQTEIKTRWHSAMRCTFIQQVKNGFKREFSSHPGLG